MIMKPKRQYCDGITRRDFIRVGAAGALGLQMTLPALLQRQAQAASGNAGQLPMCR